jgi:hypothetical protein
MHRNTLRLAGFGVAIAGLSVLVVACGGGSSGPSVASVSGGTSPTTTTSDGAPTGGIPSGKSGGSFGISGAGIGFSACMRSHGVPSFPDPDSHGGITLRGVDPSSPKFQSAQRACRKMLPHGGTPSPAQQAKMQKQALKFSACMRSHGVPKFPDPTFSAGGVSLRLNRRSGIDPSSSQFQAAQKACQGTLPGKPVTATAGPGGGKTSDRATGGG